MENKVQFLCLLQVLGFLWGYLVLNKFAETNLQKVKVTIITFLPSLLYINLKLLGEV